MNTTNVPKRLQHTASGKPEAVVELSADELVARTPTQPRRCSCEVSQADCLIHGEFAVHHSE